MLTNMDTIGFNGVCRVFCHHNYKNGVQITPVRYIWLSWNFYLEEPCRNVCELLIYIAIGSFASNLKKVVAVCAPVLIGNYIISVKKIPIKKLFCDMNTTGDSSRPIKLLQIAWEYLSPLVYKCPKRLFRWWRCQEQPDFCQTNSIAPHLCQYLGIHLNKMCDSFACIFNLI